jgi:hypothetical protein
MPTRPGFIGRCNAIKKVFSHVLEALNDPRALEFLQGTNQEMLSFIQGHDPAIILASPMVTAMGRNIRIIDIHHAQIR